MGSKSKYPQSRPSYNYFVGYTNAKGDYSKNFHRFVAYMDTFGIFIPEDSKLLLSHNSDTINVCYGNYILGSYMDVPEHNMTAGIVPHGYVREFNMITEANKDIWEIKYIHDSMKILGIDISKSVTRFKKSFYQIVYDLYEKPFKYQDTLENIIDSFGELDRHNMGYNRNTTYVSGDNEEFCFYNKNGIFQVSFCDLPYGVIHVDRIFSKHDIKKCNGDIFELSRQEICITRKVSCTDYILDLRKPKNLKLMRALIEGDLTRKQEAAARKIKKKQKISDHYGVPKEDMEYHRFKKVKQKISTHRKDKPKYIRVLINK